VAFVNFDRCHSNLLTGVALWGFAVSLAGFGAALMGSDAGEIARALAPIVGSFVAGGFVLVAAMIAWKSVQLRIDAEEQADKRKFQLAVTAELVVFSTSIIHAVSAWNVRAHQNPASAPPFWPTLPRPHVYIALVSRIGLLEGWVASAVIGFYGNVLDLIDLSEEAMRGRPTPGENVGTIAKRFQAMANYLADSLEGLNSNRAFPIVGHDLTALVTPNGPTIAGSGAVPTSLQDLLRVLGGRERQVR
jgi:hypothetical protein